MPSALSAIPNTGTDSARFLAAGARGRLWVRTRIGSLADAMPRIRQEIDAAENMIFESNSLMQFLRPDLYLSVLDYGTADFKDSARLFLDRADAMLLRASGQELAAAVEPGVVAADRRQAAVSDYTARPDRR